MFIRILTVVVLVAAVPMHQGTIQQTPAYLNAYPEIAALFQSGASDLSTSSFDTKQGTSIITVPRGEIQKSSAVQSPTVTLASIPVPSS
jgi:hypothetical protein